MSTQPNRLTQDTQPNQPTLPPNQPTPLQEKARLLDQEFDLLVDYITRLEGIVMSQRWINEPGEDANIQLLRLLRRDMSNPQETASYQTPTFESDPMEELKLMRREERHRNFNVSEQVFYLRDQWKRFDNITESRKRERCARKEDLAEFDYEIDKERGLFEARYKKWARSQREIGSYVGLV